MSRYSLLAGVLIAPVLLFSSTLLFSQDVADAINKEVAGEASEKDWLEFYYENPTPGQFVAQMKDWADDGTLDNENARPALIAFISQVIRQNTGELKRWYGELAGLSPVQMQVMHTGMLYSRTAEADEIMREVFGKVYDEQKQETLKILEMPLDKQATMDMLWGYFYATGSENAIRRMVISFRFKDAPDNPPGVTIPEGHVPMYKMLPKFAIGALISNGERHPRVVEILRELYEKDESLMEVEKEGVYEVLSALDPKKYPPVDREKKAA